MDIEKFATTLGLPGLLILVWYLLQRARDDRQAKLDEQKLSMENRRIDSMFELAKTMATGYSSLVQVMASNHAQDIESHQDLATGIAEIKGKLDESWRTPPHGLPRPPTGGQ